MSRYINKDSLFLEPKTEQYGSHMIMSNVHKPSKTRYINVDTLFSEEMSILGKSYIDPLKYTIVIPESINSVKSIKVISAEIPMSFYTITALLGNNVFVVRTNNPPNSNTNIVTITVTIPDGNYSAVTISTAINAALSNSNLKELKFAFSGKNSAFWTTRLDGYNILFDASTSVSAGNTNYKSNLGWILGFRQSRYLIPYCANQPADNSIPTSSILLSESKVDLHSMRYGYLVVDEFVNGAANSMTSLVDNSFINKKILARITFDDTLYPEGTVCYINNKNGRLISDVREYSGNVNIQKLSVQLINCFGAAVSLNGLGMSFMLKIECE